MYGDERQIYRREMTEDLIDIDTAYENLANAVILQAVRDYERGGYRGEEARNFLLSDYAKTFTKLELKDVVARLDKIKEIEDNERIKRHIEHKP